MSFSSSPFPWLPLHPFSFRLEFFKPKKSLKELLKGALLLTEWRAGSVPWMGDLAVSAEQWQGLEPEEGPRKSNASMSL